MAKSKTSTVVLNAVVQKVKDELSPIYGWENIVSSGLLLFSRLSDDEQREVVIELQKIKIDAKKVAKVVSAAKARDAKQKQTRGRKPSKFA